MEYIREKDQKVKKLDADGKLNVAKIISENFETYDRGRQEQLDKSERLMKEIFFEGTINVSTDKTKAWKSRLKTCKIFMYSQILKAFVWKNIYANTNSMFDVSGESYEADNNSNKQKSALVAILDGMDFAHCCDKVIENSLVYGELISFCTWKKHSREYRRPISFFEMFQKPKNVPQMLASKAKGEKFYIDEQVDYDNPYVYAVDPANFTFDSTQFDTWDSCPKIYRTWRTPDDIINNKYFEVSNECKDYIKNLVRGGSDENDISNQKATELKYEHVNGSTVEVLEHWGNLTMSDGTVLRNWYAVVVAGKYLVAFEKNPFVNNPFTFGCYITDPKNKRGISPLYSIYELSLTQEDMFRRTIDLQSLTENPPLLVGKGFFGEDPDDIELHPGKIIEYDNNLYNTTPVKPITFEHTVFTSDLEYLDSIMSEVSGVFPNMAGASENDRTTATEISTKVEGQLTRLKMLLDVINQNFILEVVKNVAELKSNFTFGEETIFNNTENKNEEMVINDEVRQGKYKYTYADRSATSERYNFADMVIQSGSQFIQAGLPLNLQEVFLWYMSEKGVENPERFLMQQETIDPQVQQALLQNPQLAPIIQEMQNRVQMSKQGQELPDDMPQEAPQEPQEDLSQKINSLPGRNLLSTNR